MRFDSAGTKPRIKTFPEDNVPDAGATSSALSEVALTKLAATSSSAPANYRPQRAQSTNDDHQLLSSTNEANEYHHLTDLSGLKVGMANIITICKAIGATLTSKHGNTYRQAMVEDGFGNSKRLVAFGPVGCDKIGTMQVGSVCKLHKVKVSRGKETYTTDNACVNELQINAFIGGPQGPLHRVLFFWKPSALEKTEHMGGTACSMRCCKKLSVCCARSYEMVPFGPPHWTSTHLRE